MISGHFHLEENPTKAFFLMEGFPTISYLHGEDAPLLLSWLANGSTGFVGELSIEGEDCSSPHSRLVSLADEEDEAFLAKVDSELALNPPFLAIDLSKAQKARQIYLAGEISYKHHGKKILVYAPLLKGPALGIQIDQKRLVTLEVKKELRPKVKAFKAFAADVAGIREPEYGFLFSKPKEAYVEEELPPRLDLVPQPTGEVAPQAMARLEEEAPKVVEDGEKKKRIIKPRQKPSLPPRVEPQDELHKKIKATFPNALFLIGFIIFAVAMYFISSFLPKKDDSTFSMICFVLSIAFLFLSVLPVQFTASEQKKKNIPGVYFTLGLSFSLCFISSVISATVSYFTELEGLTNYYYVLFAVTPFIASIIAFLTLKNSYKKGNY